MTNNMKLFAVAGAFAVALPASASAHHSDPGDYKLITGNMLVKRLTPQDAHAPQVNSPAQVTTPRVKIWRRTYVQGGRAGVVGIKLSCKSVAGLGCGGSIGLGPAGRVGSSPFRLQSDAPQVVRVRLARPSVARLYWHGKLSTSLTIEAVDGAGNASLTTGQISLLRLR